MRQLILGQLLARLEVEAVVGMVRQVQVHTLDFLRQIRDFRQAKLRLVTGARPHPAILTQERDKGNLDLI